MSRAAKQLLLGVLLLLAAAAPAEAFWSTPGAGIGLAGTATIAPTATPTATISGATVTVTWTQTGVGAGTVGGYGGSYVIRRQWSPGGSPVAPGAGTCATPVSGASTTQCTETGVPPGTWQYTVTPRLGSWTGATSAPSPIVTVAASGPELDDPGRYVRGTISLVGRSGTLPFPLQAISIQQRTGGGAWADICTSAASPINCSFNTTGVANGDYELRTRVLDTAGSTTFSAVRSPVTIDNAVPVATLTAPPARVRGNLTLSGTATDTGGSGLASVAFQYRPVGGSTWMTGCVPGGTGPGYSCALSTAAIADGSYELRASATDNAGNQDASTPVTTTVDNTAPAATDIQITNATGTVGRGDSGDVINFSFSEPIDPTSILASWNGSATAVQVRIVGCRTIHATLTVYTASGLTQLPLGSVDTGGPYVEGTDLVLTCLNGTLNYNASMSHASGVVRIALTSSLLLGPRTVPDNATATWTAPAGIRDLTGNTSAARSVTESGTADPNF